MHSNHFEQINLKKGRVKIMGVAPIFKESIEAAQIEFKKRGNELTQKDITAIIGANIKNNFNILNINRYNKKKKYVVEYEI